jgi:N utilization substance protein B
MMRNRTKSREYALQMLYQMDIRHATDPRQIAEGFWQGNEPTTQDIKIFANELFTGTMQHLQEIDTLIGQHADNWELGRMAVIDRNILRLGVFELRHVAEVPSKVCINEAIELAKRFGDEDSGKFINGILDAIHKKTNAGQDS